MSVDQETTQSSGRDAPQGRGCESDGSPRTFLSWAKLLVGFGAALSGLVYAVGYVTSAAHLKMLGVRPPVELGHELVTQEGIMFWPVTAVCWLYWFSEEWSVVRLVIAISLVLLLFGRRWWWRLRGGPEGPVGSQAEPAAQAHTHRAGARKRASAWRRLMWPCLAWCGRFLPLTILTVLIMCSIRANGAVLSQTDLLAARATHADASASAQALLQSLIGRAADLRSLLTGEASRCVYGFLSLVTAVCTLAWILLFRHRLPDWRPPQGAPSIGGAAQFLFLVSGFLLFFQLFSTVALYGYLVTGNEYPAIIIRAPAGGTSRAAEAEGARPAGCAKRPPPHYGQKLLILGTRGKTYVVYATCCKQVWWLDESKIAAAIRVGTCNPFQDEAGNVPQSHTPSSHDPEPNAKCPSD